MNDVYFYFRLGSTDVMYILAGLGTQSLLLLRLLRPSLRIVTNNDGIEWEGKYSWLEKKIWKSFIRSSMRASHLIIHDNSRLRHFPPIGANRSITTEYGVRISEKILGRKKSGGNYVPGPRSFWYWSRKENIFS